MPTTSLMAMKSFRLRFSIFSLLLVTAVIAVGLMLYQRHVAWKTAEAEYQNIIAQHDPSPEMKGKVERFVQRYPQLAKRRGSLEWATIYGNLEMCRHLLELGADPNEAGGTLVPGSPIRFAVITQRADLVRLLLEYGANASNRDRPFNNTLLHIAACQEDVELCQILLDEGISIDVTDASGQTPLHLAIRGARLNVVKFLLKQGASCKADFQGQTPRDVAQWRREEHVLAHLDAEPIDEMTRLIEERCQSASEPSRDIRP